MHTEIQTISVQEYSFDNQKESSDNKKEDAYVPKKCWTINGKYMCARLAMADKPIKDNIEPLPDLDEKNA